MLDHIPTDQLHAMAPTTTPIIVWIRRAQLRWIGHLIRWEGPYAPKLMLFAHTLHSDLPLGRQPGAPGQPAWGGALLPTQEAEEDCGGRCSETN